MEYYSAIERNEIEPFIEIWMNLETVIQNEVRQKDKKDRILMHICGIENGIDYLICKGEIDTDTENKHKDTRGGKGRVR